MSDYEPLTDAELDWIESRARISPMMFTGVVLRLVAECRRLQLELAARVFASPDGWDHSLDGAEQLLGSRPPLGSLAPGTFVACTSDAPRRATPGVPETRPDEDDGEAD